MTGLDPIIVKLHSAPDFRAAEALPRGAARKLAAYEAVVAAAKPAQDDARELAERLRESGAIAGYRVLMSPNALVITPTSDASREQVIASFQALDGVEALYGNDAALLGSGQHPLGQGDSPPTVPPHVGTTTDRPAGASWNQDMVGAPEAWAEGADGRGLVYGSIDSGVDVDHPALRDKYRGHLTGSDDYAFFDPMGRSTDAQDFEGHGTLTTGVAVGDGVGIAPGSTFIAAVGREGAHGDLRADSFAQSLDWMLAPRRSDGSAADPTKAPDVVGMSLTLGPQSSHLFDDAFRDLQAAGIEPVKSAGNLGPNAGTIGAPGQLDDLIAVGAVDSSGRVTDFSSRGPATTPGLVKPDFAAPGLEVPTLRRGGGYDPHGMGTSVAQPHVSGAILDILSAHPNLTHEQLYDVLRAGARDAGAPGPDPEYGHGIIDIDASLDAARALGQ